MRFLFLTNNIGGYSGVGQSAITLLAALAPLGDDLSVMTRKSSIAQVRNLIESGELEERKCIVLPNKKRSLRRFSPHVPAELYSRMAGWFRLNYYRLSAPQFEGAVIINGIHDALDFHSLGGVEWNNIARHAIIIRQSPSFFTDSNLLEVCQLLVSSDLLLSVSRTVWFEWVACFHRFELIPPRHLIIPNVVRSSLLDRACAIKAEVDTKGNKPVGIVCVGGLMARKGQDVLVSAARLLAAKGLDFRVTMIGPKPENSSWADDLLQEINSSDLLGFVEWVGPRPDAIEFIATADILVLPSRAEALPRVVIEAMALGVPCVATNVDGIPELIEHEVTGLLVDPDSEEHLAGALAILIQDHECRAVFGCNAKEAYERHFSEPVLKAKMKQALEWLRDDRIKRGDLE